MVVPPSSHTMCKLHLGAENPRVDAGRGRSKLSSPLEGFTVDKPGEKASSDPRGAGKTPVAAVQVRFN